MGPEDGGGAVTQGASGIHDAAARGFQRSADRYERGRPGYPPDAIELVVGRLRIGPGRHVVELGAGTGKCTSQLVPTGASITAVEPVAGMREVLERACPTVTALDGTAEAIPLADATADAVIVAQAFHWFDAERALGEIHRILRAEGRLGLIWNVRDESTGWSRSLTAIFDGLSGPGVPRYKHGTWREAFETTDLFGPLHNRTVEHVHPVTREGFIDRVTSVSYVASASAEERQSTLEEVAALLEMDPDLADRVTIEMSYQTEVFWCERR